MLAQCTVSVPMQSFGVAQCARLGRRSVAVAETHPSLYAGGEVCLRCSEDGRCRRGASVLPFTRVTLLQLSTAMSTRAPQASAAETGLGV